MKTHMNLATEDLERSIDFYSKLLDAKPTKRRDDYALFVTERPPLELALDAVSRTSRNSLDHYGICVETMDEVEQAIQRLEEAGLASSVERDQTCCYAKQSKVWAIDPAGRRWEIYTVHEDTPQRDSVEAECCSDASATETACCGS